jgi:hypothetical protein
MGYYDDGGSEHIQSFWVENFLESGTYTGVREDNITAYNIVL